MRSIEDYANHIIESVGLKFTQIEPTYKYDKKKKVGVSYRGNGVRFVRRKRKEWEYIINIQVGYDPYHSKIFFGFGIRNKDKMTIGNIVSYGGNNIGIYKNYKLDRLFFIEGKNLIIRNNDFGKECISYEDFNSEEIVNDICNTISNMYNSDADQEEKNTLLEYLRPAVVVLLMETKDLWDRLITKDEGKTLKK